MSKKIPTKRQIRNTTIKDMKSLGIYKEEYNPIIDIYVDVFKQYLEAEKLFEESGYQYETTTGAGGTKKSAIVATLENLRKDYLAYSDRLCLNPQSNKKKDDGKGSSAKQESPLERLMRSRK
ncbi:P27 family phage terminase small subunit [Aquibacillus kalidii]|uniref:P27 family phage terminase small subunit n=1 Tax=Aquibacillus kalidii TaxID=2762597 RepID=UPI002E29228A|nr:P27 family phage terminase small subunit [Aquibacillus kalidii]